MKDDLFVQLLAQTSESIQKLFDLSTRIDERVKFIQSKQADVDGRLTGVVTNHLEVIQRLAVAESRLEALDVDAVEDLEKIVHTLDRRIISLEQTSKGHEHRWNAIFQFAVQLIWITLAAYVLYKLNLNPPPVP